jgi:hypothetical protein
LAKQQQQQQRILNPPNGYGFGCSLRVMHSSSRKKLYVVLAILFVLLLCLRSSISVALSIFSLPVTWSLGARKFFISRWHDDFDLNFEKYPKTQVSSLPEYPDAVPPILHHIALGHNPDAEQADWSIARNNCLAYHPGWETHLWTDEKASAFVNEKYPLLKEMWNGYKYPIQRVDALRYLVLYEYGGMFLTFATLIFTLTKTSSKERFLIWILTAGAHLVHCGALISLLQLLIQLGSLTAS